MIETILILTSGQVVYGNRNWNTTARGVYPVYQTMQNWQIAEGSWFSDEAEQTGAHVAVLGQTVVQNLFSASTIDPIGQTIRINSQLFRVVSTVAQICRHTWTSVVRAALIQSGVPGVPATFQGVIGSGHVRESMQAGTSSLWTSS